MGALRIRFLPRFRKLFFWVFQEALTGLERAEAANLPFELCFAVHALSIQLHAAGKILNRMWQI
jgi:hypothetical protein